MESYVYVIAAEQTGPVKIGRSRSPEHRIRSLQTGHANQLHLYYKESIAKEKAVALERLVHRDNASHRLQGEWFDLTVPQAINEVKHTIMRYNDDPQFALKYGL